MHFGYLEDDIPRMVKTPWSDEEIPFEIAAEVGTKKVIAEHSTIRNTSYNRRVNYRNTKRRIH